MTKALVLASGGVAALSHTPGAMCRHRLSGQLAQTGEYPRVGCAFQVLAFGVAYAPGAPLAQEETHTQYSEVGCPISSEENLTGNHVGHQVFLSKESVLAQQEGQHSLRTDLFSPNSSGDGVENGAQSSVHLKEPSTRIGLEDIEFGLD